MRHITQKVCSFYWNGFSNISWRFASFFHHYYFILINKKRREIVSSFSLSYCKDEKELDLFFLHQKKSFVCSLSLSFFLPSLLPFLSFLHNNFFYFGQFHQTFSANQKVDGAQHLAKNSPLNFTDIFATTFAKFMTWKGPKIRQICALFASCHSPKKGVEFFAQKCWWNQLLISLSSLSALSCHFIVYCLAYAASTSPLSSSFALLATIRPNGWEREKEKKGKKQAQGVCLGLFFIKISSLSIFVKWCSHNEIQSNSKVYSSFASIYINPVIN